MTENEAKRLLKIEKECINRNCDRNCAKCDILQKVEDLNCAYDEAIKALEEVQQYRKYKDKFEETYGDCDGALEVILDLILEYEIKEMKGSYIIRLLTDEDAKKWDEYKHIGTPEVCRKAVEICKAMIERNIAPENIEEYTKFEDECVKNGFPIDSLLKAREKQTAKRPITYEGTNRADCPVCGETVRGLSKQWGNWCSHCGQKLDWGMKDE